MQIFKKGKFSANVEAVLQMGKAKFIASHPHIEDADVVYDAIEKSAAKEVAKESKKK